MTGIPRMLLGSDLHGALGMFATLPGFDATTTDPADKQKWAFRSDWDRIENLHQVGLVTGLSSAPAFGMSVTFPALTYVPFVSVRYLADTGVMQDDPWCKCDTAGTDAYMSPYRVIASLSDFSIGWPTGASTRPTAPVPPSSAVYFVWRLPVHTP